MSSVRQKEHYLCDCKLRKQIFSVCFKIGIERSNVHSFGFAYRPSDIFDPSLTSFKCSLHPQAYTLRICGMHARQRAIPGIFDDERVVTAGSNARFGVTIISRAISPAGLRLCLASLFKVRPPSMGFWSSCRYADILFAAAVPLHRGR